jgi:3-oxoacyl-(acyl-carrier-protein) synthase
LPDDIHPIDLVRVVGSIGISHGSASDPAVELAERAIREACMHARISPEGLTVITGASKGAVHRFPKEPLAVVLGAHGYWASELTRRLKLGCVKNIVAACASGLYAVHHARELLLSGKAKRVLVVTAEAALLPHFIASSQRLGILAPMLKEAYIGRPLDENRNGFMLSQVGAAMVMEASDSPQAGQWELLDTAVGSEAYDIIRPAPGMPTLSHIAEQLLGDRDIDLLHPHATGTRDQDAAELAVYRHHAPVCDVYANKGAIGHTLGSAGMVSLILACLCAKTKRRPPMPWLTAPIEPQLSATLQLHDYRTHAVFATGFGGHVAGAVMRRF